MCVCFSSHLNDDEIGSHVITSKFVYFVPVGGIYPDLFIFFIVYKHFVLPDFLALYFSARD